MDMNTNAAALAHDFDAAANEPMESRVRSADVGRDQIHMRGKPTEFLRLCGLRSKLKNKAKK